MEMLRSGKTGDDMLRLIYETKAKKAAQETLAEIVKDSLPSQGTRRIGFKGGNRDRELFSAGEGELWASISKTPEDTTIPRYWNAFGIFEPERKMQLIAVEINVPSDTNGWQVAGAFAQDDETGDVHLMHDGAVGGGRPGIGQEAFLISANMRMVEVLCEDGRFRKAIPIGNMSDAGFVGRLARYVSKVADFKHAVSEGELEPAELQKRVEEAESYDKEFSGTKRGRRGGTFAYETYHGEIVDMVVAERHAARKPDEKVYNTQLIDCYVRRAGKITEVYEIKTGVGRQQLYTAIGQLVTHAAVSNAAKFLVVPTDEHMPKGFDKAIKALDITVRGFRLAGTKRKRIIELDPVRT
ncbi:MULTISPECIES: hypothetical protein [unclassified Mesorhizobium]|nr:MULTISPECIES: hypothetical protein [unclassified Mesorhizobium]TGQ37832.1 hypothetical protein EN857_14120 [Mesorhizobium sp. M4B.F.Ca.ET.214.01.1.1]TGQ59599.1 hypothetical protein EN854_16850 [Mesorhizobium sp. M4B.F.Ca.ET.211.01.1.1]TGU34665.1 hypothetical protein EN793_16845 [Mesorhizobium sp. M4B.F.Ca.ET.150.01.1.1]